MAANTCSDVVDDASATPAETMTRRLKLRRRPSASASLRKKARKLRTKACGGRRPRPPAASRKRVMVIRRKMEALRRLVPVCGDDGVAGERVDDRLEELLLHAAGYILRLQMQVSVMQVMVHALNNTPED